MLSVKTRNLVNLKYIVHDIIIEGLQVHVHSVEWNVALRDITFAERGSMEKNDPSVSMFG